MVLPHAPLAFLKYPVLLFWRELENSGRDALVTWKDSR